MGHWTVNFTYKQLATTKASKVWFLYSHNCTLANGAVFPSDSAKFDCALAHQNVSFLAALNDCETYQFMKVLIVNSHSWINPFLAKTVFNIIMFRGQASWTCS